MWDASGSIWLADELWIKCMLGNFLNYPTLARVAVDVWANNARPLRTAEFDLVTSSCNRITNRLLASAGL